jgi:polysaccharide biosynthesis protein PslJ
VRLRRTGFEGPIFVVVFAALSSILANTNRVSSFGLDAEVTKELSFFASYVLLFFAFSTVAQRPDVLNFVVRFLVLGATGIAVLAMVESRFGYNAFDALARKLPFLEPTQAVAGLPDFGRNRLRAFGPAQHPIALGALFVMLLPLAIYLERATGRRRWWAAAAVLALGAFSTVSRTTVIMLAVGALVLLVLRPRETSRLWPAALVLVVAAQLAVPGTLGGLRRSFFPKEGLIAEQERHAQSRYAGGRVSDLAPSAREFTNAPLLGQGFGTRIPTGPNANARLLDDQWLKSLLETGIVGVAGLLWLVVRAVRRFGIAARREGLAAGWFFTAVTASVASFAVGMLFYDAFSFIQSTLVFYILLGLGAGALVAFPAENAGTTLATPLRRSDRRAECRAEAFPQL